MTNIKSILFAFLIFSGCSTSKITTNISKINPAQFSLLDSTKAYKLVGQCSRAAPEIDGSWNSSDLQIQELENHLTRLNDAISEEFNYMNVEIDIDINMFFRQYAGIIISGEKLIYVNAFPEDKELNEQNMKSEPVIFCDGGPYNWGVIYDPKTKEFRDLSFNGPG